MEIPVGENRVCAELQKKLDSKELNPEERQAIEELEVPIRRIMEALAPDFAAQKFGVIIGDDASGRIPALMVWEIAKSYARHGAPRAEPLRFIAGSRHLPRAGAFREQKRRAVSGYVQTFPSHGSRGALIVTDVLETGEGLEILTEELKKEGWAVTIASVGIPRESAKKGWRQTDLEKKRLELERGLGARIIVGMHGVPAIYRPLEYGGGKDVQGVQKHPLDLFAEKNGTPPERVAAARRLALEIARKIASESPTVRSIAGLAG